jgi:hypothetical protein
VLILHLTCDRIMLDVSSLKGGAPGRTRGLDFQVIGASLDLLC